MAKNKVINTVLTLQDKMSGGLVAAAKAAKKSGKNIDDSMIQSTRQVIAFKNKSIKALTDTAKKGFDGLVSTAKKSALAIAASISGIAVGFAALDGATEEYRVAQGKLNTGFQAAGLSADTARKSYRNFYAILGDTDTATEASQLLANMAKNEQDVVTWTRIAAGVHGTFGDSLPIEGLVESANETARTGQVTGVFADALNWVGILEDDFNAKLEKTTDVSKRNQLIMDTLSKTYDKAADSFYANNQQVINARRNHATLDEMLAKVGDTSSKLKNQLWVMAGAAEDGSIRSGSALDWIYKKADDLTSWISSLDLSALQAQIDAQVGAAAQKVGEWLDKIKVWVENGGLSTLTDQLSSAIPQAVGLAKAALDKAGDALKWCRDNSDTLVGVLKGLAAAWGVSKVLSFVSGLVTAAQTVAGFVKTVKVLVMAKGTEAAAWIHSTAAMVANKVSTAASAVASGVATGATAALTAAQWALNAAFVATPIGWIVLGLAAIVAGGVALYKNWDTVKAKAGQLWDKTKTVFSGIKDAIVNAFSAAKDKVAGFFSWLDQKLESVPILGSLYKGGKAATSWLIDKLQGNALGTPYFTGGYTRVNERGGEIMRLPNGTQIIPHDVSVQQAGGRSVTVNVTIQGNVIGNREYTEQVGEYVGRKVLAALGNT